MANGLVPRSFWTFPTLRMPSLVEDLLDETVMDTIPSGLSISEDDKNVYIDAAMPGIDPKNIEVTFDKGVLHISGEGKEEEKKRKYYRKATSAFSYRIAVPAEVSPKTEPEATYKNGVMHIAFKKMAAAAPKKIAVKVSKES